MTKKTLYLDLETYSATPIKSGTYRYAADAEILLFAYAYDNLPAQVIDLTADSSAIEYVKELIDGADMLVAHNSMFDRSVLSHHVSSVNSAKNWHDTMVQAYIHSLPGGLSDLCDLLGIGADKAKDKEGKKLINLFCKPQGANRKIARATADTHPAEWDKFVEYARLDVEAMRAVHKALPEWNNETERPHWVLDQKINDRGFLVDVDLVESALTAIDAEKIYLKGRAKEITGGVIASASQTQAVVDYLRDYHDIQIPDLTKPTVEKLLTDDGLPTAARQLLENRQSISTTSTSKYTALANAVNADNRLRGTLQFAGAMRTGRWAGRTFQPQNLPRPTLSQTAIDNGILALKANCAELVTDDIMALASSSIRSAIIAPVNKKLVVSDLSNIEGRVQCWLASQQWKLDAFSDFDKGIGYDLYKVAYAASFGIAPADVNSEQRQIGKVQELALGYQGGVGAFSTFAEVYGIDLNQLANDAWHTLPEKEVAEAANWLEVRKQDRNYDHTMTDRAFIACDVIKRMWRTAHNNINDLWYELERAAISAIEMPTRVFRAGMLAMRCDGAWLRIRLPSGRYLCYPNARVHEGKIQYKGVDQFTRKWKYLDTYGGKLFENICQAVARDILAHNMHTIDDAGYKIVLTVHDEVICETPDTDEFNEAHLSALLATPPQWAKGLPLAAGGFECYSYRKD